MTTKDDQRELHPAEISKIEAESRKIEAEAKKIEAEAEDEARERVIKTEKVGLERDKLVIELEKMRLETETAEQAATVARVFAAREVRKEAEELAKDSHHHRYNFSDVVNDSATSKCITQLTTWVRQAGETPITVELVINSPGGDVIAGFALIDFREKSTAIARLTIARTRARHAKVA